MAAEYGIDLLLTIKNSNKLKDLNREFQRTNKEQHRVKDGLDKIIKGYKVFFPSLNNVVRSLNRAQEMFNKTALGTRANTMAAKDLVAAQRLLNHELEQRNRLLKAVRGGGFESNIVQNVGRSRRGRSGSGFAAFSARADVVTDTARKEDMKARYRDKYLKNIDKKVAKIATIQTQQQSQRAFAGLPKPFGVAGGQIGPALPRGFRVQQQFKQGGMFGMPGGAMGRLRGGAGSAMIGGGFPLLFGAGGLSSIMGGIAGGIGGALAPGGGFAASIAATALAAQIEKVRAFRKEVSNLNKDMSSMGIESEFSRKQIKDLAKEFDITNDEAVKLAATFKTFGSDQTGTLLSAFGSREIFDSLSGLRDTESVLGKIQELSGNISEEKRRELLQTLATDGALEAQLELQKEIIAIRRRAATDKKMQEFDFEGFFTNSRGKFKKAYDTEIERQQFRIKKQKEFNEEFNETNKNAEQFLETQIKINEQIQFLAEFNAPTDRLREMLNPLRQILDLSTTIKDGFEDSFKGMIRGTMSVSDAFRSMLNKIADYYLDFAAELAAVQLQKGFLSLFSNMFNFGGNDALSDAGLTAATPGEVTVADFKAKGGPVKGGNSYIVGERGPELFSPGVSGMITPNHALGGSTNVVINVDASGSNVEGNQESANEFGEQLAAAVQAVIINEKRVGGLLG